MEEANNMTIETEHCCRWHELCREGLGRYANIQTVKVHTNGGLFPFPNKHKTNCYMELFKPHYKFSLIEWAMDEFTPQYVRLVNNEIILWCIPVQGTPLLRRRNSSPSNSPKLEKKKGLRIPHIEELKRTIKKMPRDTK